MEDTEIQSGKSLPTPPIFPGVARIGMGKHLRVDVGKVSHPCVMHSQRKCEDKKTERTASRGKKNAITSLSLKESM